MKTIHQSIIKNELSCHTGPVEIIKNLFCGNMEEALGMVSSIRVDTLIPLYSIDPAIWDLGFRGEILYFPIEDYGVLPSDVLEDLVSKILDRLGHGKKVGLFCLGGHGRTGYIASVVLGKLGYDDPIGFLRSHYCSRAVESDTQLQQIAKVLEKPELVRAYVTQTRLGSLHNLRFDYFNGYGLDAGFYLEYPGISTCGDCGRYTSGICQTYGVLLEENEIACECFLGK